MCKQIFLFNFFQIYYAFKSNINYKYIINKNGFNIIIHEDTNKDTEINHAKENINYIAIE